jgi:hypothetical protein
MRKAGLHITRKVLLSNLLLSVVCFNTVLVACRHFSGRTEECEVKICETCSAAADTLCAAAKALRKYQTSSKNDTDRAAVTKHAANLVIAIDAFQQSGDDRLAAIAGRLIRRIGRHAHG